MTVGGDKGKVNGEAMSCRYRSNAGDQTRLRRERGDL